MASSVESFWLLYPRSLLLRLRRASGFEIRELGVGPALARAGRATQALLRADEAPGAGFDSAGPGHHDRVDEQGLTALMPPDATQMSSDSRRWRAAAQRW